METAEKPKAQVIETKRMTTIHEQENTDREYARKSNYYSVILMDDAAGERIRVRTPVWVLDEEGNPILKDGQRQLRNPHDVALDVWAAQGADDHTLEMVQRGAMIVATPRSIANELSMRNSGPEA